MTRLDRVFQRPSGRGAGARAPLAYQVFCPEDFGVAAPSGDGGCLVNEAAEPVDAAAATAPAEPVFSRADLDAARSAGCAEGQASERSRREAQLMTARMQALGALGAALSDAAKQVRETTEASLEALARAVLSVVAAAVPALCARHGEAEVRALLSALLPTLQGETITVRVNPDLIDAVRLEVAALEPELASAISLQPVAALPFGDVRVSWESGLCQRSADAACAAVREALTSLGLAAAETFMPSPSPLTPVLAQQITGSTSE